MMQEETQEEESVKRFLEIEAKMASLYKAKNADYGDSFHRSVERYGLIAGLVRIDDKVERLRTLVWEPSKVKVRSESIMDTLLDLASYAVMTAMELEGKQR